MKFDKNLRSLIFLNFWINYFIIKLIIFYFVKYKNLFYIFLLNFSNKKSYINHHDSSWSRKPLSFFFSSFSSFLFSSSLSVSSQSHSSFPYLTPILSHSIISLSSSLNSLILLWYLHKYSESASEEVV